MSGHRPWSELRAKLVGREVVVPTVRFGTIREMAEFWGIEPEALTEDQILATPAEFGYLPCEAPGDPDLTRWHQGG